MELGATVCTPKQPLCSKCPVSEYCYAFKEVTNFSEQNKKNFTSSHCEKSQDIEDCHKGC